MSVKSTIKKSFIGRYALSEFHRLESWLVPRLVDDEAAVKRFYKKSTGKNLNLENPTSFDEKLNWYKLNDRKPLIQQCADKIDVRKYVEEKGYGYTLNDIYGIYSNIEEFDENLLPEKFVVKAAHGSHMVLIVKDKKAVNWRQQKIMMRSWLCQDIAWSGREWCYKDIPKRLVAEKYVVTSNGALKDYKFFCFNGEPKLLFVDVNRFDGDHFRNYYYTDWTFFPYHDDVMYKPDAVIEKPACYDEMLEMAKVLSQPFQQVRVDLYDVDGKIMFGELTFFHNGGITHFPEEASDEIGKMWKLVK